MILVDNYDSFTFNIVQYFRELGVSLQVFSNDEITVEDLKKLSFSSIVLSPGPGNPLNAGICLDVIKEFYKTKKILGICLGMQCIAEFFGAEVIQDKNPVHGKVSKIFFDESSKLFRGIPQGFLAARYHSLVVDPFSLNDHLSITASSEDGILMGIEHSEYKIYGVQFHPEAILTEHGKTLFQNFLDIK